MDQDDPNSFVALRRRALEAEAELRALASLFQLAVRGVKQPEAVTADEVRLLCEGVLRHVKPSISARGAPR